MLLRLLCLLLLLPTIPSFAQELLRNGNFDRSGLTGLAQDWIAVSQGPRGASGFELKAHGPNAGAQKIIVRDLPPFRWSGLGQALPELTPGLYRFRVRVKPLQPLLAGVEIRGDGPDLVPTARCRELVKPGIWTELTGFAQLDGPAQGLYFLVLLYQPGTLLAADASLQPVERAALTPAERATLERQFGPLLPPVDEAALLADTDARILRHRTAPLTIQVLDPQGQPAPGRTVHVEHLRHLFRFGAAFDPTAMGDWRQGDENRRHREAFLKLFNAATVQIYWPAYDPDRNWRQRLQMRRAVHFLEQRHFFIHGHPVFWNASAPSWLTDLDPPPLAMERLCDERLVGLGRALLPRLTSADLFNELVHWERLTNAFTRLFIDRGKTELVAEYLRETQRLAPGVQTTINDYDLSPEYFGLLKTLLDAGAPLDLIGQQAHMHSGYWSVARTWTTLERLSLLRRPILFTEVSALSGPVRPLHGGEALKDWPTDPENEARQAAFLEQFYKLLYSHPNCAGLTLWNYTDRYAWLGAPVGILRQDGRPKPSFERLDHLINHQWRTRGDFQTDAQGCVKIDRAFAGAYSIRCGRSTVECEHRAASPLFQVIREERPLRPANAR